jgi:hypothetical protein
MLCSPSRTTVVSSSGSESTARAGTRVRDVNDAATARLKSFLDEPIAARAYDDPKTADALQQRLLHFVSNSAWSDHDGRTIAAKYALNDDSSQSRRTLSTTTYKPLVTALQAGSVVGFDRGR